MPHFHRHSLALLSVCLFASVSFAQSKVLLSLKGKVGSFGRYADETTVKLESGGEKLAFTSRETVKSTVTKIDKDGTLTFERKTESLEMSFNGEKLPPDEKLPTMIRVVRPDGSLVSMKDDDPEPDPDHLNERIIQAQWPVFSDKAVGVGEKWKYEYKVNPAAGTRAAEGQFTLLAFEEITGVKCAKIKMEYHELGASPTLSSQVVMWVELVSGDVVQSEHSFENVPFPTPGTPTVATAKGTSKRTGGGPLPESGPAAAAEVGPKKIDDVTKGFEKLEGVFTFYKKRDAGRQTIYLEIKKSQLDQLTMLQTTASTGTSKQLVTGSPVSDIVFRFSEVQPDKLTLVVPNFAFRSTPSTETNLAMRRSFADSFVEQFTIEARSTERDSLLIDVSDLFRGDLSRLSLAFQGGLFSSGGSYSLDREKTFVSSLKAFPENVVVETTYNLMGGATPTLEEAIVGPAAGKGDPRSMVVKVVYNLFPLKSDAEYSPRPYDARVGYFTVWFQNFDDPAKDDQQVQNILRWNVQKKDPLAEVSEPVKPIVFWLDNAIPQNYRQPLRDGVLVWNQAFERIGIRNAIEVRQMPADADWDPADMRYNVIRWVVSPSDAYAVSQPRVNPLTGEIINGSILVDANMVRFVAAEQKSYVQPLDNSLDLRNCRLVQRGTAQAWLGLVAASDKSMLGSIDRTEYVRQFLLGTVCHEFGHMLGLRHNFAGSTEFSLDELGDPKNQPSASVMDYVPFNVAALGKKGVDYYGLGLGTYDFWAIEYGYKLFGKANQFETSKGLQAVASQCNMPGHAYQSDENADGYDPFVTRFDLGKDPLAYWQKMHSLSKSLVATLGLRSPAQGESYFALTRELQSLLSLQATSIFEMTRFVGGLRRNVNFKGDPNEQPPLTPVTMATQRSALSSVCKLALSPEAFSVPKSYLTLLVDNPNNNLVQSVLAGSNPYNILDTISLAQGSLMDGLLDTDRLRLVANNEFKSRPGSQPLTVGEIFNSVQSAVWSELSTGALISIQRRQLQRHHLDLLIEYAIKGGGNLPADVRMWALAGVRELRTLLILAKAKTKDQTTLTHLDDCSFRIEKALDARDGRLN